MRAMPSVLPPAAYGTITVTSFCGHCCAKAPVVVTQCCDEYNALSG
jgi:hypothetical protein